MAHKVRVEVLRDGEPIAYRKGLKWFHHTYVYEGDNLKFALRFIDGSYTPEPGFSYKVFPIKN